MKHSSVTITHRTSTDRRRITPPGLRIAGVAVLLAIGLALAPVPTIRSAPRAALAATRPNVLIIIMDDQRDQGTLAVQPNVRRLFQSEGVAYANAFDTTPLCCPARGSLFSGRYPHNTGVRTNADPDSEQRFDQKTTLVYHLQNAGYATAMAGKYWNKWPQSTPPRTSIISR